VGQVSGFLNVSYGPWAAIKQTLLAFPFCGSIALDLEVAGKGDLHVLAVWKWVRPLLHIASIG
jgi:hypothetical protein